MCVFLGVDWCNTSATTFCFYFSFMTYFVLSLLSTDPFVMSTDLKVVFVTSGLLLSYCVSSVVLYFCQIGFNSLTRRSSRFNNLNTTFQVAYRKHVQITDTIVVV